MKLRELSLNLFAGSVFIFLLAPIIIVIVASFTPNGYLEFPPRGISLRWYGQIFASSIWMVAFGMSVALALVAAAVTTFICFLVALVTTRKRFVGKAALELGIQLPMMLPHAALAMVLFSLVLSIGMRGTFAGLALAHFILVMPFVYRPLVNGLRQLDLGMEEAAMTLGASPSVVFRKVTLPIIRPSLVSAFLFSFIVSFDEVTVSMFLIGVNLTTLPVKILSDIQNHASPVIAAVSTLLMLLTLVLVLAIHRLVGIGSVVEGRGGH